MRLDIVIGYYIVVFLLLTCRNETKSTSNEVLKNENESTTRPLSNFFQIRSLLNRGQHMHITLYPYTGTRQNRSYGLILPVRSLDHHIEFTVKMRLFSNRS